MPPRADERDLVPLTYVDFTQGLYERGNDRECPQTGLLEAQDCMPLPSGGLRAAWAWTEEQIGNFPTNRRVMGFDIRRHEDGGYTEAGLMLGTTSTVYLGPFTYEYWFAKGTTAIANATTWTSGRSHSSMEDLYPVRFAQFFDSAGNLNYYYNVAFTNLSTVTRGVFQMPQLESTSSTQVFSSNVVFVAAHQDRLLYVTAEGTEGYFQSLRYTNPSTVTAPSSNLLTVGEYRSANIGFVEPIFPQDLFVLKPNQGGFLVQGDLNEAPFVREMLTAHVPERFTWSAKIPGGMAHLTQNEGVWLWSGGETYRHLSRQIVGSPMTEVLLETGSGVNAGGAGFLGSMVMGGPWLFTPKGYIYDVENDWWFRSTLPGTGVYSHWVLDRIGNRVYAAGYLEPGSDVRIISASMNQSSMQRSSSFRATLPIIDMAQRNIQVREIEVFGQGFGNGGTWQATITNELGESEVVGPTTVPARAFSVRWPCALKGDWLKIRLFSDGATDATSPTGKSEAPMIERVVAWGRPRQRRSASYASS